ncbi:myosin light chain kinase 2, skeletal/cardiac muscle isoform X2 [Osmerus mordax]|uniref:myosin light chain kinase 2, skeletal/cardiac muscle isoform X2 n=1 Tax=Osmerus mordax TaxID=8014 RepID=UPI0035106A0E
MGDLNGTGFDLIQNRIESLSSKMDRLINIQEKVLNRLDGMSQDIDGIERDVETLKVDKEEIHVPSRAVILTSAQSQSQATGGEVREMCQEMSSIMSAVNQRSQQQAQKLEGMEKLVLGIQQVIGFIGETVKSSRVMDLMFKGPAARKAQRLKDKGKLKDNKGKDGKDKSRLSLKGLKAQKKKKPPDPADTISLKKQALLLEEVQKLNRENAERSDPNLPPGLLDLEAGGALEPERGSLSPNLLDFILEVPKAPVAEEEKEEDPGDGLKEGVTEVSASVDETDLRECKLSEVDVLKEKEEKQKEEEIKSNASSEDPSEPVILPELPVSPHTQNETDSIPDSREDNKSAFPSLEAELDQMEEVNASSKRRGTEEDLGVEDHKKSRVERGEEEEEQREEDTEEEEEQRAESEGWGVFKADGVEIRVKLKEMLEKAQEEDTEGEDNVNVERFFIDTAPPPAAPFNHRIVSAKPNQINNFYTINRQEILGGGRFGQVHKCIENSSGLTLAAKIIKARSQKEKDVVKNEIQVMNQLDHANLIQLYAAYESRNDIILVLEFVDGGELFDRIIDENYTLKELDTVVFIRQICEGLQHMHKMYILHLDLKPENILCVSRVTNKIKIIDFGLARIYKPREKLRVNFGTPEFLAPEVINYDFVSFNTDMWSLGVIAYMLLSGLCPFLGDDDNETLNNILACQWNFDEEEFLHISDQAKDFISKLLVINKSWRIGASEALRHPWLSDSALHHRLHEKKTMCRSRRSSCVPPTDS